MKSIIRKFHFLKKMDTAKPFSEMLRVTPEPPQGDGKATKPYYLDPPTLWDN